jgi:hypothetical protein
MSAVDSSDAYIQASARHDHELLNRKPWAYPSSKDFSPEATTCLRSFCFGKLGYYSVSEPYYYNMYLLGIGRPPKEWRTFGIPARSDKLYVWFDFIVFKKLIICYHSLIVNVVRDAISCVCSSRFKLGSGNKVTAGGWIVRWILNTLILLIKKRVARYGTDMRTTVYLRSRFLLCLNE